MLDLTPYAHSPAFSTVSLRPPAVALGHVLNVDHFRMSQPTFPPHPHAGFSAVTWMLPWSEGAFVNRDSLGDRSRIGPGTLHWTLAGRGMLHEEVPERPGVPSDGLQIFVKLPEGDELTAPRALHLGPDTLPTLRDADGAVIVLVGAVGATRSPVPAHADTTLAHVAVSGARRLDVPAGLDAFALVLRGEGRLNGQPARRHQAVALPAGALTLDGDGFDVLVGWSTPLPARPTFQGPFCMFDRARLTDAVARYRSGAMGALSPSF